MIEMLTTIKREKTKMNITTIGLDIAKHVFHLVCCNQQGRLIKKKMLRRHQVLSFFQNHVRCLVALEACATSHYWAREIEQCGHTVKLIPPQHVKTFLIGNKNDYNDALAIAVAANQHHIKQVGIKTIAQQDAQALLKARELVIGQRTALCNHVKGLLAEYGICLDKKISSIRKSIPILLEDTYDDISDLFKSILRQIEQQLATLDKSIVLYEKQIKQTTNQNDICKRLQTVPGIGPIISSAYFNEVGNGATYRKGRDVSASLGLVPKQHSSGGKDVLLGISKKGNRYLRCLLVQGAKTVVSRAKGKDDKLSCWINRIVETRGHNRACVAYANKMSRMAWAVTTSGENYIAS
ncbi:MAG: transposase [Bermanella sp.]|jgi:transposase